MSKLTVKMLRHYDEIGLLVPQEVNAETRYRLYSVEQIGIAADISKYKEMGLSLTEIVEIVKNGNRESLVVDLLEKKQIEIKALISIENERLTTVEKYIKNIKEGSVMEKIYLRELPEVIVASKRVIIPDYNALFTVVPEMGRSMGKQGAICRQPPYCFNMYHDKEYKEKDIDVEICEAVVDYCKDGEGVVYKKIEKVSAAACIEHKGSYDNLNKSYGKIYEWIEENGYKQIGEARESFIDGCWNKDNEEEWLTIIEIPVEK